MIIEYLLAIFIVLYGAQIAVMLHAVRHPRDVITEGQQPFVSIIVAARDEGSNLASCLDSVLRQSYPKSLYEIIAINDHSTDATEQICRTYSEQNANFSYVNAREDQSLRGKTNALDQGIELARGEIILITDADCTVPATWVEWTARRYDDSVGIVGGMTLQRASNWFEGMQSLDWAFLLGLAAATMSLRVPLSTIGNNLSFRKSAYNDVGGYRKIPFSVTEDFMLFQAIVQKNRWDYICPIDPRVLVISRPCRTWQELLRQKHRWGRGGMDMKLSGLSIMAIGFGLDIFILAAALLGGLMAASIAFALKMIGDYAFLHSVLRKQRRTDLLRFFPWFELYFVGYVLVLPFLVFFGGRVIWKGRAY
jgi:1,2-diacylglycerol 3-beta-glucosyltransferase